MRYDIAPIAQVKMIEFHNINLFKIFVENNQLSLPAQRKLLQPRYADMLKEYTRYHAIHPAALKN